MTFDKGNLVLLLSVIIFMFSLSGFTLSEFSQSSTDCWRCDYEVGECKCASGTGYSDCVPPSEGSDTCGLMLPTCYNESGCGDQEN